ncbi:ATP-dependent RNA helicase DBP4-like [Teratosphaeria destructans]|uniref:ATP-dependent RNA helicase DBP4-like n=1 Tax=Teratosphaeria destructans TaxID=418781 RepID=A0A9W7SWB0_9PEZI|nr:ATP-dependent RNA helicase DBP4-like [Teratosphaeria destructans]
MANQQIVIAETIRAMKHRVRRERALSPPSSSDSEDDMDDLHTFTNRGSKLRKSAQYAHAGRLDSTGGQAAYKRKVTHAGYERYIIKKKPKLYDEDGDVIDPADIPSDADEDEHAYGEPIEADPFSEVRLEDLLRPLTSAAELPVHPSLSVAYTNQALTKMVMEAAHMVRQERAALWKAKRLLMRFRGDGAWMGLEKFETEQDHQLLDAEDDPDGYASAVPSIVETEVPAENDTGLGQDASGTKERTQGDATDGVVARDHVAGNGLEQRETIPAKSHSQGLDAADTNGVSADTDINSIREQIPNPTVADIAMRDKDDDEEQSNSGSNPSAPSHAMTTRARARSPQPPASPSPSPSDSASVPTVHPWFQLPPGSMPDRDLGLPPMEAEETRKLLLLYVQKQENIVRQLETLYDGLQKTDRLRSEVYRACKAEAHMVPDGKGGVVTEMSDGEDWYDPDDWSLGPKDLKDGKLEKGKDEVEDLAEEEGRRVGNRRRRVVGK